MKTQTRPKGQINLLDENVRCKNESNIKISWSEMADC